MSWGNILFSFYGRINRAKYWVGGLFWMVLFSIMIGVLIYMLFSDLSDLTEDQIVTYFFSRGLALFLVVAVVATVGFVSGLALGVKRLHDRDKSGWWVVLFYFAPSVLEQVGENSASNPVLLVASIAAIAIAIWGLVEMGFRRGTVGPNSYGPDSLAQG